MKAMIGSGPGSMNMVTRVKLGTRATVVSGGRLIGCALAAVGLALLNGCGIAERNMNVNVIVYNYSPSPIGNVRVQGQPVLGYFGEYGPGGTGGSVYCCIEIEPGEAEVQWELGGPVDSPEPPGGWIRTATAEIPQPNPGDRYLGVEINPDGSVEFTLSSEIRRGRSWGGGQ